MLLEIDERARVVKDMVGVLEFRAEGQLRVETSQGSGLGALISAHETLQLDILGAIDDDEP